MRERLVHTNYIAISKGVSGLGYRVFVLKSFLERGFNQGEERLLQA